VGLIGVGDSKMKVAATHFKVQIEVNGQWEDWGDENSILDYVRNDASDALCEEGYKEDVGACQARVIGDNGNIFSTWVMDEEPVELWFSRDEFGKPQE